MNLVTREMDDSCIDWSGYAQVSFIPIKPVNTVVCADSFRPTTQIQGTAAHEFIHAVGLGHSFNKPGDLMCSIENGKYTCGLSFSQEKIPSDFNLAAVGKIYGKDGFLNPNSKISYKEKFYASDSLNFDSSSYVKPPTPPPTTPTAPTKATAPTTPTKPTPPSIEIVDRSKLFNPFDFQDTDSDGIIDSDDKCRLSPETFNGYLDTDGCPDSIPKPRVPDFVDPAKGAQHYIDRYNNEIEYRLWFHRNYPDYSIKDVIELAIPDAFSVKESKPRVPDFVEPSKGAQYYLDRYNNEPAYKTWFDRNYPDYTIEEAIKMAIPDAFSKPEPEKEKFCFLFWCW